MLLWRHKKRENGLYVTFELFPFEIELLPEKSAMILFL